MNYAAGCLNALHTNNSAASSAAPSWGLNSVFDVLFVWGKFSVIAELRATWRAAPSELTWLHIYTVFFFLKNCSSSEQQTVRLLSLRTRVVEGGSKPGSKTVYSQTTALMLSWSFILIDWESTNTAAPLSFYMKVKELLKHCCRDLLPFRQQEHQKGPIQV